jgi:hypothetical protein
LLPVWRSRYGRHFELLRPFLRPTASRAESCPCRFIPPCDCDHIVRVDEEWGLAAVCACGNCQPFRLDPKDLLIYGLDTPALGEAVRHALQFQPPLRRADASRPRLVEIGWHAPLCAAVYLALPESRSALLRQIERLALEDRGPFLLLTPTRCSFSPETDGVLNRTSGFAIPLEAVLLPRPEGQFKLRTAIAPMLASWATRLGAVQNHAVVLRNIHRELAALRQAPAKTAVPAEPVTESAARQAFALLKEFESEGRTGRAPVLQVFRLYCMEGLTAGQVARKLGCSKATVLNRLAIIRDKSGIDPEDLRQYSTHFEQIEESLSDSRAKHIDRRRAIEDADWQED